MRKRSRAREYALQMLYQLDVTRTPLQSSLEEFWAQHTVPPDVKAFATALVQGTTEHLEAIDQLIATHANNWDINRMAVVDRNILRMGVYELLYLDDVPPKVSLNEAIELAKRFGDEESGKFVNGILDTVHKTHPRQSDHPAGPQTTSPSVPS